MMYYTYMLRCSDNSLYTGITTDVFRRFNEHKSKSPKAAKYTTSREVVCIAGVWQCDSKITASKLEFYLKKLPKTKKEMLLQEPQKLSEFLSEKLDIDKCVWIKDRFL